MQNLEVAAAVLERALGDEHFAALQREIGAHASYRMTEAQAEAVVRLQLGQLAALERDEIFKEYNELREQDPSATKQLLASEQNILAVIRGRPGGAARQVRRRPPHRDHRRRVGQRRPSKT